MDGAIFIIKMSKLRLIKVKYFAQGNKVRSGRARI